MLTGVNSAWNSHSGITLICVNRRGMFVRLLPPFPFLQAPQFFAQDHPSEG